MLVLTRALNERLVIGNDVTVRVLDIRGDKVRLGIEAPRGVPVDREEVRLERDRDTRGRNRAAMAASDGNAGPGVAMAVDEVKMQFLTPPDHLAHEKPRIPALEARIAELERQADRDRSSHEDLVLRMDQDLSMSIDECSRSIADMRAGIIVAMDHCPTCAGMHWDAISRCEFCRRLQRAIWKPGDPRKAGATKL